MYAELTDRPSLRDLCSNPLVLSMYVANFQRADEAGLPDTRTTFYEDVVQELLVMRRSKQLLNREARVAKRSQREAIFGRLALENMLDESQPSNSLSSERALDVVCDELRIDTRHDADRVFRHLAKETGIVSEERPGESFRFIHLTFCEYFAALEAVRGREDRWEGLLAVHDRLRKGAASSARTRLLEVVPFSIGLMFRGRRRDALFQVAGVQEPELLARCLIETQAYDHAAWAVYAERESEYFRTSQPDAWDEAWLRRLHLYQTAVADSEQASAFGHAYVI